MLNRILVLEALFSFSIVFYVFGEASPISAHSDPGIPPADGFRGAARVRVAFQQPSGNQANDPANLAPFQHRPVIVKRSPRSKTAIAQAGSKADPSIRGSRTAGVRSADVRDAIVEKHVAACQSEEVARRMEERRRALEANQSITPVVQRR